MTQADFDILYTHGRIAVSLDELRDLGIDEALAAFIAHHGLPDLGNPSSLLGLRFEKPFAYRPMTAHAMVGIAREEWADDLYIGIEPERGHVLAFSSTPDEETVFINSSVAQFLGFLSTACAFLTRPPEDAEPTILTSGQAAALLAAFRRGEIRPKKRAPSYDRPKEIARIRKRFRQIDRDALVDETWWSSVLEQMDDGLI